MPLYYPHDTWTYTTALADTYSGTETVLWQPLRWQAAWEGTGSTTNYVTISTVDTDSARFYYNLLVQSTEWVLPAAPGAPAVLRERTAAEEAEIEAYLAKQREELRSAEERALQLLCENISEEQRAAYLKDKRFVVRSQSGRLYEVRHGRAGNVYLLGADGEPVERYCAHPVEAVPDADTVLAQKLMLETEEERFLELANRHPLAA